MDCWIGPRGCATSRPAKDARGESCTSRLLFGPSLFSCALFPSWERGSTGAVDSKSITSAFTPNDLSHHKTQSGEERRFARTELMA